MDEKYRKRKGIISTSTADKKIKLNQVLNDNGEAGIFACDFAIVYHVVEITDMRDYINLLITCKVVFEKFRRYIGNNVVFINPLRSWPEDFTVRKAIFMINLDRETARDVNRAFPMLLSPRLYFMQNTKHINDFEVLLKFSPNTITKLLIPWYFTGPLTKSTLPPCLECLGDFRLQKYVTPTKSAWNFAALGDVPESMKVINLRHVELFIANANYDTLKLKTAAQSMSKSEVFQGLLFRKALDKNVVITSPRLTSITLRLAWLPDQNNVIQLPPTLHRFEITPTQCAAIQRMAEITSRVEHYSGNYVNTPADSFPPGVVSMCITNATAVSNVPASVRDLRIRRSDICEIPPTVLRLTCDAESLKSIKVFPDELDYFEIDQSYYFNDYSEFEFVVFNFKRLTHYRGPMIDNLLINAYESGLQKLDIIMTYKLWYHECNKEEWKKIPNGVTHLTIQHMYIPATMDQERHALEAIGNLMDAVKCSFYKVTINFPLPSTITFLKLSDFFNSPIEAALEYLTNLKTLHLGFQFKQKVNNLPDTISLVKIDRYKDAAVLFSPVQFYQYTVPCTSIHFENCVYVRRSDNNSVAAIPKPPAFDNKSVTLWMKNWNYTD